MWLRTSPFPLRSARCAPARRALALCPPASTVSAPSRGFRPVANTCLRLGYMRGHVGPCGAWCTVTWCAAEAVPHSWHLPCGPPAAAGIIPNFMVQGGDFTNGNGQCGSIITLQLWLFGWMDGCRLVTLPASWFPAHPSQPYPCSPRAALPPRHGRQVHLWPHLP